MFIEAADIHLNYKANMINDEAISLLADFAQAQQLNKHIQDLAQGEIVNVTESRAAWHMALRDPKVQVNDVHTALQKIAQLCEKFQNSNITDVVHFGVGGSFWGPKLVVEALQDIPSRVNTHFVAELDEVELNDTLSKLDPKNTLFIIASKSFSTSETLLNAERAKKWLQKQLTDVQIPDHFIAVTEKTEQAKTWGLTEEHILPLWDWVGGRFSVWSAVGLPIALSYGMDVFQAFLRGAHAMDQHFINSEYKQNMPVVMAFLSYTYTQFHRADTQAILPYAHRLRSLVPHIQQLCMESLGKHCNKQGEIIDYPTGPVIWGATGTHAQHTFNQLIHQGSHCTPVDFILINDGSNNAQTLRMQCLAQSQTMALGDPENPQTHRRITGKQPHNIIELNKLTPETLGALLALYEHKVATLGHLLNINPFDQFGVEHSKTLLNTF